MAQSCCPANCGALTTNSKRKLWGFRAFRRPFVVRSSSKPVEFTEQKQEFVNFRRWCAENRIFSNKLEIFEEDGYRGLRATEEIQSGEVVIKVPKEVCITSEHYEPNKNADTTDAVELLYDNVTYFIEHGTKNPECQVDFGPYLALLPQAPVGLLALNPLAEVLPPALLVELGRQRQEHSEAGNSTRFFDIARTAAPPQGVSVELWKLAVSLCHSRAMTVTWPGTKKSDLVVAPLADFLNHSSEDYFPALSWGWRDKFDEMWVWADRKVKRGEELCISYGGDKNNAELLAYYGFVDPDNRNEKTALFDDIHHAVGWFQEEWGQVFARFMEGLGGDDVDLREMFDVEIDEDVNVVKDLTDMVNELLEDLMEEDGSSPNLTIGWHMETDDRLLDTFQPLVAFQLGCHPAESLVEDITQILIQTRCSELLREYSMPPNPEAPSSDMPDADGLIKDYMSVKKNMLEQHSEGSDGYHPPFW